MATKRLFGKNALTQLYRGVVQPGRPLLMLDFDDVICLQAPYGGYDVFLPESEHPADLWDRLWSPQATAVLLDVVREFQPQLVLTTSWVRLMDRDGFVKVFERTGLGELVPLLHPHWEAPQASQATRWSAIERWLAAHYEGQPVLALDDPYSGSGLKASPLYRCGRVLLCEVKVGLLPEHLPAIRQALQQPA